jgi:hypothetical protein
MTQSVLVVHGAGEPRLRQGRVYWEPLLGEELGSGYQVHAPRMPEPTQPTYRTWADCIAQVLQATDHPVLVGHSLGASVLLKYVAEADPRPDFRGLFLVAAPFWKTEVAEFALTAEELDRLRALSPLFFYQSRDDEEIGFEHLGKYARALPHATFRELDGRGHEFDQEGFPELVADIRSLAGRATQ